MDLTTDIFSDQNINDLAGVCRHAGREILQVYGSSFTVQLKADRSPLTEADQRSHNVITGFLKDRFDLPVLSEEGREIPFVQRKRWQLFWLVDPLDGTKEFVNRSGDFTVNIALINHGRPAAGFIYLPVRDVLYYAVAGEGSYKISQAGKQKLPLPAPGLARQKSPVVIASRSHQNAELKEFINRMKAVQPDLDFISAGSSLKFCLVAEGAADIYPRIGPTMEWDTAAGQIIVEEAGGQVLNVSTRVPLVYNKASLLNPDFVAFREAAAYVW